MSPFQRLPFRLPSQPIRPRSPITISMRPKENNETNIRQKPHSINLPQPQRQQPQLHQHINRLNPQQLPTRPLGLKLGKHRIRIDQALDGPLEQHEDHHDTEDLETVAGEVHHDGVHGELFGGGEGDFPGLFDFEGVGFDGFGRGWLLLLLLFCLLT